MRSDFATQCATLDGPNTLPTETGPVTTANDVWFKYTDDVGRGVASFSTCPTGDNFDSVLAVYHDASNPTSCVCPKSETSDAFLVNGIAANETCSGVGDGSGGFLETCPAQRNFTGPAG